MAKRQRELGHFRTKLCIEPGKYDTTSQKYKSLDLAPGSQVRKAPLYSVEARKVLTKKEARSVSNLTLKPQRTTDGKRSTHFLEDDDDTQSTLYL